MTVKAFLEVADRLAMKTLHPAADHIVEIEEENNRDAAQQNESRNIDYTSSQSKAACVSRRAPPIQSASPTVRGGARLAAVNYTLSPPFDQQRPRCVSSDR